MAAAVHLCRNLIFIVILAVIFTKCYGNDILGCGGFVKSHVALDFSKIEIGLYTKSGSLKEHTECAPTNGYYFLPLYEKGEYVLKVHPPPGWSFEPSEVELVVDGTTDKCSTGQDINFAFNGFGITGRVITAGQKQGPNGIAVQLINDKGEKRDTVTTTGGDFHFTPVIPGKYTLKASHSKWKLDPAEAVVQVKEGNTALPVGVLAVKGYDVKGSVVSYGNPISGVYVLLYSKEDNQKFRVEGCKTALLQGVPDSPICHAITDAAGEFSFGLVPAGEYKLLALSQPPGQVDIRYNIKPESVPFAVLHDSLYIKDAFEVTGFTVVGSVVSNLGGASISGVRVLKDGQPVGKSDASGKFTLASLQPGTYTLSFQHEQCQFDDIQVVVSAAGPRGAVAARAARWRVEGGVAPLPANERRDVAISTEGGQHVVTVQVSGDNEGKWSTFLPPGVYSAKVEVSEAEQREGLQFYPLTQKISVGHGPVSGVSFSQLKARVSGRVSCRPPAACAGLRVTLRPLSPDGGYQGQVLTTSATNGEYTFSEVLPGSVEVSVPTERLCWAEARHNVAVTTQRAAVPAFQHAGYALPLHASHDIQVEYSAGSTRGVLTVPAGPSRQCVPTAAQYTLTPRGPHRFQPAQADVDTASDHISTTYFVAVAHAVTITVMSPTPVTDLTLKLTVDGQGSTQVGPLEPREAPGGGYRLDHTAYMAEGEVAVVSAYSKTVLVTPAAPQQVVGRAHAQPAALTLRAVPALTLAGRLVPPVDDVTVTLQAVTDNCKRMVTEPKKAKNKKAHKNNDLKMVHMTTADGTYSFGPLDASKQYTITAEKESYVFGARDPQSGDIAAHKLAEITVLLLDDATGAPLQGALVSVSGGAYRRNAASGAGGGLRFAALSPAQYYVKPNMKEYRFTPPHHIITVDEGKTHHVILKGVRVAWSCSGRLVSLAGAGWAGAALLAAPQPGSAPSPPHCRAEEASTETDGEFRIRGLLPKCVYSLQLKDVASAELRGLKLVKAPATLEIKENKDIENVRLIAIQPTQITDTNMLVHTPNIDHYKTLRLTLALENTPHTPIYSTKLDAAGFNQNLNPGLMYVLPRLPADNKTYVLQLESTLSKASHSYGEEVHYFNSDGSFKYFNIEFLPKTKSSEQELRQTSLLVVPLLGIVLLAWWQRDLLLQQLRAARAPRRAAPPARAPHPRPDLLDKASIDHILNTVNPPKKSKKKVQ